MAGLDRSWDALFESAGQLVDDGWVAELAIPFKSLRFPPRARGEAHRWGFQILRQIRGKDERAVWAPVSRDVAGFLTQMGVLEGLSPSIGANLEILPTFTAVQQGVLDRTTGRFTTAATQPDVGVNVKYGLASNLTVDATVNPDFSQIESDRPQIDVNQRFPLFFPELRPFFIEGQEIFDVGGPVTLVHTRTIVDPQWGAKMTGKVGDTTVGVLVANDEAAGRRDETRDPLFGRSAQVVIGRVRQDLYADSYVGAIVTDRELGGGYNRVVGVDGHFRLGQTHQAEVRLLGSDDRDEHGLDQRGYLMDVRLRRDGRHLSYGIGHFDIEPGFRAATGFVRRVDMRQTAADVSYRWWPEHGLTNWGPRVRYTRNVDFAGVLQDEQWGGDLGFRFAQNVSISAGVDRDMERFRGVPFRKTRYAFSGTVNASRRVAVTGLVSTGDAIRYIANPFLGHGTRLNLSVLLRPFSRLQSEVLLTTSRLTDPRTRAEIFDVKIVRALTTYQFTDRFLVRNITEYDAFERTLAVNLLFTYRVNAGTALYAGYDERYQQGIRLDETRFPTPALIPTNRAIFLKWQYLFRR